MLSQNKTLWFSLLFVICSSETECQDIKSKADCTSDCVWTSNKKTGEYCNDVANIDPNDCVKLDENNCEKTEAEGHRICVLAEWGEDVHCVANDNVVNCGKVINNHCSSVVGCALVTDSNPKCKALHEIKSLDCVNLSNDDCSKVDYKCTVDEGNCGPVADACDAKDISDGKEATCTAGIDFGPCVLVVTESESDHVVECKFKQDVQPKECVKLDETNCVGAEPTCVAIDNEGEFQSCKPNCIGITSDVACGVVSDCVWLDDDGDLHCQPIEFAIEDNSNCDFIRTKEDCEKLSANCVIVENDSFICSNNINSNCHTSIAIISGDNNEECICKYAEDLHIPDKSSSYRCSTEEYYYCNNEYMTYYSYNTGSCKCKYAYDYAKDELKEANSVDDNGGCSDILPEINEEDIPNFDDLDPRDSIKEKVDFLLTIATESDTNAALALEQLMRLGGNGIDISSEQANEVVSVLVHLDPGDINSYRDAFTTILTNCALKVDSTETVLGTYPEEFAFVAGQILQTMNYESFNGENSKTLKRIIQSSRLKDSAFQGIDFVIKNFRPRSAQREIELGVVRCSEYSSTVFLEASSTAQISTFSESSKTAKSSECTISFDGVESKSKCESENCPTSTYAGNDETLTCECTTDDNGVLSFKIEKENGGGLSGGVIAGIVIGVVAVVVVAAVIIVVVMRSKSKTVDVSS